jgi:hypothetical protein
LSPQPRINLNSNGRPTIVSGVVKLNISVLILDHGFPEIKRVTEEFLVMG